MDIFLPGILLEFWGEGYKRIVGMEDIIPIFGMNGDISYLFAFV